MFSVLLGLYLGVELLGHMLTLCLTFQATMAEDGQIASVF